MVPLLTRHERTYLKQNGRSVEEVDKYTVGDGFIACKKRQDGGSHLVGYDDQTSPSFDQGSVIWRLY
jgi:hypothetical protein